jgi:phosphoribosylpyrophosphate synthetase
VLIIDDMINTGASMCAIANKLKKKKSNLIIDGLAIVGSLTEQLVSDI